MFDLLSIAASGVIMLGGAMALYAYYLRLERERLKAFNLWSKRFASHVDKLARNPATPRSSLEGLRSINRLIGVPGIACMVYFALRGRNASPPTRVYFDLVECDDEALAASVAMALCAGLMTLTYSSRFWGVRARAVLAERLMQKDIDVSVVKSIEKCSPKRRFFHDSDHGVAAKAA